MIRVNYLGRFGNNIFQYCIARIIAEKNGFAIKGLIGQEDHRPILEDCDGYDYSDYPVDDLGGDIHIIDLELAFSITPRQIYLNGFYQIYDYYKDHKNQIIQWLKVLDDPILDVRPEKDSITLSVRGSDLWNESPNEFHVPCPFRYYDNILRNETYSKIYLVTEDANDPVVEKIKAKWNCEIITLGVYGDFNYLRRSEKIVMSVSTFTWWAAWLSDAEKIYFPEIGLFHPELEKKQNLIVDESRYEKIRLRRFYWTNSKEQRNYILDNDPTF